MSQVEDQTLNDTQIVENESSNFEEDGLDSNTNSAENNEQSGTAQPETSEDKVELDLDDAPFLEEDKVEEEEAKPAEGKEGEEADGETQANGKKKFKLTKKKIIILGGALLVIIIAVVAVLFLTGGGEPSPEEPAEVEEVEAVELEPFIVVVEEFKEPQGPPIYTEELEPFWIQMKDSQGGTIFLVCNFSLVTEDAVFYDEIKANIPQIRDSIYYYLASREHEFLTNHDNFPAIKEGLLVLINKLLKKDQLTEVLYNSYLTK